MTAAASAPAPRSRGLYLRARTAFFWLHLTAGCAAGLVVLMMAVTGVLLTYERQIELRASWASSMPTLRSRMASCSIRCGPNT